MGDVLGIHLFRGQVRVYHSEENQKLKFISPVKDMDATNKVIFVAEVFEYDDFPTLDLVMLRGSFQTDLQIVKSGMRYEGNWESYDITDIGPRFENYLRSNEKKFISESSRSRNFRFKVELEWKKRVPVIEEPQREIASVEEAEFEDIEIPPVVVHEDVHDLISIGAAKIIKKVPWYKENRVKGIDYRERALQIAIEKISVSIFFRVKKMLERDLLNRANTFTGHLVSEGMTNLENKDIKESLWVVSSQYVDSRIKRSLNFDDQIYVDIKDDIERVIYFDIIEKAREWSYSRAKNFAEQSYKEYITKNRMKPIIGAKELIESTADRTASDFSNMVSRGLANEIAKYQVKQSMRRAVSIVVPTVQKKLKRMYQLRMYAEVERLLSDGRARVIASQREGEYDEFKTRYQNQEYRNRRRQTIRNFRN